MNEEKTMSIDIAEGISKKDPKNPKPWKAVKVTVGDWSQMIFVRTKFEMDYIESIVNAK